MAKPPQTATPFCGGRTVGRFQTSRPVLASNASTMPWNLGSKFLPFILLSGSATDSRPTYSMWLKYCGAARAPAYFWCVMGRDHLTWPLRRSSA